MKRRVYFLFPDVGHVTNVVAELHEAGFRDADMHVIARRDIDTRGLPQSNYLQLRDFGRLLESWVWKGNLMLFFAALIALVVLLTINAGWLWLVMLTVMAVTLFLGYEFVQRIPNTHLQEFQSAIDHGEILLMVDVALHRVKEVEDRVQRHHAEAISGGVGWTIGSLRI